MTEKRVDIFVTVDGSHEIQHATLYGTKNDILSKLEEKLHNRTATKKYGMDIFIYGKAFKLYINDCRFVEWGSSVLKSHGVLSLDDFLRYVIY